MPTATPRRLALAANTAADLMSGSVSSIPHDATFPEAVAFFIDQNVTAAPVVGDLGEPIGVLSVTDLLVHIRESQDGGGRVCPATAAELMTPAVFAVGAETPAADLVADMLRSRVHRLFVADGGGMIQGVVSTGDVLRHLR